MGIADTRIQAIIDSLPNGFTADWSQDFAGAGESRYYINGANDTHALDKMDDVARAAAESYWAKVRESIDDAIDHEDECREALERGDMDDALTAIRDAADCERKWGDDPTYSVIVDDIRQLAVDVLADAAEPVCIEIYQASPTWYMAVDRGMPEMQLQVGFGDSPFAAVVSMQGTQYQSSDWMCSLKVSDLDDSGDDNEWKSVDDVDIFERDGEYYADRDDLRDSILEDL